MTPRPAWTIRSVALLALRAAIGAVFIYASLDKIGHPDRFAEIVSDYGLLPETLVNPFAVALPWIELVTGLTLVAGCWLPGAALLSSGMTVLFMVAVGWAMVHGADKFHCGCFTTTQEGGPTPAGVLWRDAPLPAASIALLLLGFRGERREGDRPVADQSTSGPPET